MRQFLLDDELKTACELIEDLLKYENGNKNINSSINKSLESK